MRKFISSLSLSIIFGLLVSWLERVIPLFNLGAFNSLNVSLASFLISLLIVLLIVSFSGNILSSVFSVFLFVGSYIGICFYLGVNVNFSLIVRLGIILISGIWVSLFLYSGRAIILKTKDKVKTGQDIAFSLIFFFASLLFALAVTLMESNVIMFDITKIFYGYLYFLVAVLLLFAFLSFNEIAGFFIGLVSLPVYFLSMRLVKSNFDFKFLFYNEREFLIIVFAYSLIFAFSAALVARSGRIFIKGIRILAKRKSASKEKTNVQRMEKSEETSEEVGKISEDKEEPKNESVEANDEPVSKISDENEKIQPKENSEGDALSPESKSGSKESID